MEFMHRARPGHGRVHAHAFTLPRPSDGRVYVFAHVRDMRMVRPPFDDSRRTLPLTMIVVTRFNVDQRPSQAHHAVRHCRRGQAVRANSPSATPRLLAGGALTRTIPSVGQDRGGGTKDVVGRTETSGDDGVDRISRRRGSAVASASARDTLLQSQAGERDAVGDRSRVARRSTSTSRRSGRIQAITSPGTPPPLPRSTTVPDTSLRAARNAELCSIDVGDRRRTEHPETTGSLQRLDEFAGRRGVFGQAG